MFVGILVTFIIIENQITIESSWKSMKMAESKQKILPSSIEMPTDRKSLEEIIIKAKDYALMHGIAMRPKSGYNPDTLQVSNHSYRDENDSTNFLSCNYLF